MTKPLSAWVFLLVVVTSGAAWACKCAGGRLLAPRDGSRDVPTNVVLRVLYDRRETELPSTLKKDDGTVVELASATGPGAYLTSFTPRTRLEANTHYTFQATGLLEASFTTGAGEDRKPPSPVTLSAVDFTTRDMGSCGEQKTWALKFSGGVDEGTSADNVLLFAHTGQGNTPADSSGVTTADPGQLRVGLCSTAFQLPADPEDFPLRLQAMDLAGNVSAFPPPKRESRCATTPGAAVLLALAWLLRRARG